MTGLINKHIEALEALGRASETVWARKGVLRRADKSPIFTMGVEVASRDEIEHWFATDGGARQVGGRPLWSANTRAAYHHHLAAFFEWATDRGYLEFDPMVGMPRPKRRVGVPRPLTDEELLHLLTEADDVYYLCLLLAAFEGLRCCEIAGLRRQDVTEQSIWIHGKGDKIGVVDTHQAVWETLKPFGEGNLIGQLGGRPDDQRWVSNLGVRRCAKYGLPGRSLHRARSWHGTSVLDVRGNLLAASSALRHSSVATTQIYAQLRNSERRAAVRSLPVIGSVPLRRLAG